jgi:hypothetical protein
MLKTKGNGAANMREMLDFDGSHNIVPGTELIPLEKEGEVSSAIGRAPRDSASPLTWRPQDQFARSICTQPEPGIEK